MLPARLSPRAVPVVQVQIAPALPLVIHKASAASARYTSSSSRYYYYFFFFFLLLFPLHFNEGHVMFGDPNSIHTRAHAHVRCWDWDGGEGRRKSLKPRSCRNKAVGAFIGTFSICNVWTFRSHGVCEDPVENLHERRGHGWVSCAWDMPNEWLGVSFSVSHHSIGPFVVVNVHIICTSFANPSRLHHWSTWARERISFEFVNRAGQVLGRFNPRCWSYGP